MRMSPPVYPRWRGEHPRNCRTRLSPGGLSPLARGTHVVPVKANRIARFIPAGAGNTTTHAPFVSIATVYPRWRGEHSKACEASSNEDGLSPLARGTRFSLFERFAHQRFIPAGAGNTAQPGFESASITVYPRWRGEHFPPTNHITEVNGLSPLARGTQTLLNRCNGAWRFIPAGAGNTYEPSLRAWCSSVYPRWRGEHLIY